MGQHGLWIQLPSLRFVFGMHVACDSEMRYTNSATIQDSTSSHAKGRFIDGTIVLDQTQCTADPKERIPVRVCALTYNRSKDPPHTHTHIYTHKKHSEAMDNTKVK